jgi:outer membrane protein TolC
MMSFVGARALRRILSFPAASLIATGVILAMAMVPRLAAAQPAAPSGGAPRPLSLAEALTLATGESEQIAIARAGSLRAQGQLGQARSALFPQLATTMNWQKQLQNQFAAISERSSRNSSGGSGGSDTTSAADNPITRIFASQYNFNVGLSASQPLYGGGRATANIRAARAARESAEIGITSAQAQVQLDVTQSYYDALLTDRLVAIAESSLVQSERTLRQVQLTRNVGSASEFDLIRARVTRDNQRPGWLQSRTNRDLAYVRLRQLLNLSPDQPLALTDSIAESPVSAPVANVAPITTVNVNVADVLTIDPQVQAAVSRVLAGSDTGIGTRAPVKQALKGVEVAQQQLRATKAQRLPSIGATTVYQRLAYPAGLLPKSLGDFFPNWTVGIGLSYPFFTGGRLRGEVQAAEATVIEARQRLRLAQEGASLDARQAVAQLTESEASWQASVGTAEQAQRAYDIAEVRFREGISTQLELSETRNQLQQALANRAQAARNLQVARKRLELLPYLPLSQGSTSSTGPTR